MGIPSLSRRHYSAQKGPYTLILTFETCLKPSTPGPRSSAHKSQISLISIKGCVGDALTLTLLHVMYITLALNTIQIGGTKILS